MSKNMRLLGGASSADVEQRILFSEWVLSVGNGEIGDDNDDDLELDIPSDLFDSKFR
ncbi:ATP-dependent DNA helicase PIF1 [Trifolium pratense]|uniref:ATP-dependent DNA helicase PIF1 n=1 Tax=Trifolium pratense TaxID=57577 RepID=A0A2K3LUU1_TRIPR|nr:ATP-dependent DNA helicase PIF1 [Trifolium pratense]